MGNSKSHSNPLNVDDKPYLSDTSWTLHRASFKDQPERKVSLFKSTTADKPLVLDKCAKNLMLHRHPSILKYVASWSSGGITYLATEEVTPLAHVIANQTPLQICVGLQSVLKAVKFLHEKALSSHNNVCQSSIYVTQEGYWKLGGLEYLCRFSDLSARFLADSHQGRYQRAISPNEDTRIPQPSSAIDLYAFGVLMEEVLKPREAEDVPGLLDIVNIAKNNLQAVDCKLRPTIETLLQHNFFSHRFIAIRNFLAELPLKSNAQKQVFFIDLHSSLAEFNGEAVASQLSGLLLSRMVILDPTAHLHLLPRVLTPQSRADPVGFFSEQTYREYIIPRLVSIFHVRDIYVRITLLKYFSKYCHLFTIPQLNSHIIPELLVGVMDLNDDLVAASLRALADLVPDLGAAAVIGGKRAKHFFNGFPKTHSNSKSGRKLGKPSKISNDVAAELISTAATKPPDPDLFLSERPSPDGGEVPNSPAPSTTEDDGENWDNWDPETPSRIEEWIPRSPSLSEIAETDGTDLVIKERVSLQPQPDSSCIPSDPPLNLPIEGLENLNVKPRAVTNSEELDFFRDMEPVISKTQIIKIQTPPPSSKGSTSNVAFKFDPDVVDNEEEVGWGDDSDWPEDGDALESSPHKS